MNGIIQSRKFFSRVLVQLNEPLGVDTTFSILNLAYFLVGRFAMVAIWTIVFLLEIPLHLFQHTTKSFSLIALRGPQLDFRESYSAYIRRQQLAIVSVLCSLLLLIGQLTYLGYSAFLITVPTKVDAVSDTIDINPSWDGTGILSQYWQIGNPCTVFETTYEDGGADGTTLTYGRDLNNPTDCDVIEDYYTRDYYSALKFSLASIPNNATITAVNLIVNVSNTTAQTGELVLIGNDSIDTLSRIDGSFVGAVQSGSLYTSVFWSTTGSKNVSLSSAVSHVQSRISGSDVLPIGLFATSTTGNHGAIDSVNHGTSGNRPILRVAYTIPPTAPSGLTHTTNATSTITWSWTDNATGETRYDVRDGSGNVAGCTNLPANTTSCTETGLSPNTQYSRTARVTDADGTADSAATNAYTSIQTPTSVNSSSLQSTSITVAAAGTISNLGNGLSALWFEETVTNTNSGWITTNLWQKTGLSPNTTYTFRVKARNGDGDETAFTATSDFPTLAAAPNLSAGRTTSTWYTTNPYTFTSNVTWGAGGIQYYGYVWNTSSNHTFTGVESTWSDANAKCPGGTCTVANTTISQNAVTDGNSWYLHVLAHDVTESGSGGQQSYGPFYFDGTTPTAPATVNDGTGADISSQTSTTSLSANWTASTDTTSGLQKYQYAIGTTSGGTDVVAYTDNGTNTSVTASGLSLSVGSTYYTSVRAVDVAGNIGSATTSNGVTLESGVVPPTPDTTGPVISSIATDATSTTATIRWVTNEAATARVVYGLTTSYGDEVVRTTFATDHQLALTGLTPSTTYHFRLTSVDASNNSTSTTDDTFTTAAAPVVSQGVTAPTLLRPVVRDGKYPSITITGVGKGNQTITFYVNDRAVKSVHLDGELSETKSFAVKLLANLRPTGKYTVTAIATQSDGRMSEIRQRLTFRINAETTGEKYVQPSVVSTYIVHAGDSLWKIAARMLGDGNRWTEIAAANTSRYPTLSAVATILVGWALTIPAP